MICDNNVFQHPLAPDSSTASLLRRYAAALLGEVSVSQ